MHNMAPIIEWDEPAHSPVQLPQILWLLLGAATITSFAIGVWQHDSSMYIASGAAIIIATSLYAQRHTSPQPQHILLNRSELCCGTQTFSTSDLAGFWLHTENGLQTVTVVVRGALMPLSLNYGLPDSELRHALLEIIPEVVAPKKIPRHLESWLHI